jgi:hypothetical protein
MLSPEIKQFIKEHLHDDVRQLALRTATISIAETDFPFILNQIAGRQQIKNKIPSWYPLDDLLYPPRLSLEQCSSEATARYKASLLSGVGDSFVDLTGGWGVDTAFIAPHFVRAAYVEKQAGLSGIAAHNFSVLGLKNITIHTTDGTGYLQKMHPVDCIYIDPSRRAASGRKMMRIEDCEPDLTRIHDYVMEKSGRALIKLSPMLDIQSALKTLKKVQAVHVLSHENECKELLFLLSHEWEGEPLVTCMNLKDKEDNQSLTFKFTEEREATAVYTDTIGDYLYEPNVSLLKAGFYKGLASRFELYKLHPDSHLYTSSELRADFPGRIFRVEAVSSLNRREVKAHFPALEKANISIRNFPLSVVELRKKWKWKEGGDVYLFATTLASGKHVLIKSFRIFPPGP